jgi:hypothetical protein
MSRSAKVIPPALFDERLTPVLPEPLTVVLPKLIAAVEFETLMPMPFGF